MCYILKERAQKSWRDIFCHTPRRSEEKWHNWGLTSLPACADSNENLHLTLQPSSCYLKLEFHSVWDFCLLLFLLQGETLFPPAGGSDMPAMPSGAKAPSLLSPRECEHHSNGNCTSQCPVQRYRRKKKLLIVYLPFANMQKQPKTYSSTDIKLISLFHKLQLIK